MIKNYKIIYDKAEWDNVLDNFCNKDVYFEYNYFDLYRCDGEKPAMVYLESHYGKIAYPFMLRDIGYHSSFQGKIPKNKFFDIGTPFGYSGPLIESKDPKSRVEIIKLFYKEFEQFCRENNVVSEFIKFSPLLNNHKDMEHVVDVFPFKKVAITNLQDYGDPLLSEVKPKRRKMAKKCLKYGLRIEYTLAPESLDRQIELYYKTMDRKHASKFFYFSKDYFKQALESLSKNLLLINIFYEEELVQFGLCFIYDQFIHAHVAGISSEYIKLSPSNLLYADTIRWGHENGYKYFFSGGGLTSAEDDSLYHYKKSFAINSDFDSYLGNRVWDKEAYDYLVGLLDDSSKAEKKFFPLYRCK